jgi:hypothetical protein
MSGGTSALWRASLCGLAMALSVFSTGCAIQNGDVDDTDEDVAVAQAAVGMPQHNGGLKAPKNPVTGPKIVKGGAQAKSPAAKLDEVSEPEPEPWHPDTRGGSDDPDDAVLGTTPDRTGDHK